MNCIDRVSFGMLGASEQVCGVLLSQQELNVGNKKWQRTRKKTGGCQAAPGLPGVEWGEGSPADSNSIRYLHGQEARWLE